jgi:tripartite-type tricarboxylate transporter receptor subunit TctC
MRKTSGIAAVILIFGGAASGVLAQSYPAKPIRMMIGFPPGGGTDIVGRIVAQKLGDALGQQVIVDNRGGASGQLAAELVSKAAPDGYTIMMAHIAAISILPSLVAKLPYDAQKDFAPVSLAASGPNLLVVHPSVPAKSVRELIALAKARPGEVQFASGGAGAGAHLSGELLKHVAGIDIVHVPYKGNAPALNDVLGGQVSIMFDTITTALPHVKAGKLQALAVTSAKRSPLAPELPTMIEAGLKNFDISAWYIVLAPAATPAEIVQRLNTEINKAMGDPELRARMASQGVEFAGGTPAQADAFVRAEIKRWREIIKTTGMSAN